MPFTVFVDGAKLCLEFSWNLVAVTTCVHFKHPAPGAGDFQALADTGAAAWAVRLVPQTSNQLAMGQVEVFDLSEEFAPKFVSLDEVGTLGAKAADSVPNNTSPVISHRTAATGRSGRGRNYIPGISEADEGLGKLQSTFRDALLIAWGNFITDIAVTGWEEQVAQRFLDGVQLTTGVMRPVVTEIMTLQLGTQRRRQVPSLI